MRSHWILWSMLAGVACSGGDSADAKPEPSKVIALELDGALPSHGKVKLTLTAPADWKPDSDGALVRNEFGEAETGIEFTATCGGDCTRARNNLDATVDGFADAKRKPNVSSDPELDKVRLDVAIVEQGKLDDGKYVFVRVTKPATVNGPYREQLVGVCARMVPGKDYFVYATAWTPISKQQALGTAVMAACKTFALQSK